MDKPKTYLFKAYCKGELHDAIETTDIEQAMSILGSEIVLNEVDEIIVKTIKRIAPSPCLIRDSVKVDKGATAIPAHKGR